MPMLCSRPSGRSTRPLLFASVLLLAAAQLGCAGPRRTPPLPPIPGYDQPGGDLARHDLTALQGRLIMLDPGHGGRFRGAVGPNGLTEAEVNLGVALHLRGLLEWAGAEVHLTRTADTDLLTPPDSSLVHDLELRVTLTNELQPDVFISIHHNSNAALDRTINETQTYYPLDDDGASLDLARSVHRQLVTRLGISPASLRPGNFHVLRGVEVPAILGEPAMISHPVMAERLSLAASQRLEAEAYLLGLADYFRAGRPTWSGAATDTLYWGGPADPAVLTWIFQPEIPGSAAAAGATPTGPGPDPSQIHLTLDGQAVSPGISPDGYTVTWRIPADLPHRFHRLELRGRNLADRATPRRQTVLLPRSDPTLEVSLLAEASGRRAGLSWQAPAGQPLPTGHLRLASGRTVPVAPGLPAATLLSNLSTPDFNGPIQLIPSPGTEPKTACGGERGRLAAGQSLHLVQPGRETTTLAPSVWRERLSAAVHGFFVGTTADEPVWLESPGLRPLLAAGGPVQPLEQLLGTVSPAEPDWLAPLLVPGLFGRVIVLDPAGGGTATDGRGPLGLRGADLNLATAHQAADLLTGAGAVVHLTRRDESEMLPVEKVRLAARVGADFFLTIARHPADAGRRAYHHPGSRAGQAWAEAARLAAATLPGPLTPNPSDLQSDESSAYLLRHTACPALEWQFDPAVTAAAEWRQGQPGWPRAEARAVLMAFVRLTAADGTPLSWLDPAQILRDLEPIGGLPTAEVEWARLDGNFLWSHLPTPAPVAGTADSLPSRTGPGLPALLPRHVLEVHAGRRWQVWQLDRRLDSEPDIQLDIQLDIQSRPDQHRWRAELVLSGPPPAP